MNALPQSVAEDVALSLVGLAVIDAETFQFTSVNEQYCKLVGRSESFLSTCTPIDLTFPEDRYLTRESLEAVKSGRSPAMSGERRHLRPDGSFVWLSVLSTALRDAAGKVCGIAAVTQAATATAPQSLVVSCDISEQHATLDTLRDAERRKDEFLATLAHELRNPLAPIRNAAEILRVAENDRTAVATARRMIERQLQQMVRLIDDLLDVSRITRGHVELRRERVSFATVLQLAIETSRPLIESRQHVLKVEVPREALYLKGDPTRLAQVFSNLLNNSAKYSEAGGLIVIHAEHDEHSITVTVSDKGIGIEPEMLPRVFEMFTQAGRPGSHPQEGLGIGLTLVRRLVELHGGTVVAQSEGIGRGSQFVVRLPLEEGSETLEAQARAGVARTPEPDDARDGLRILVADDNRDAAASLAMMLDLGGHEIRTAYDGIEALTIADEFQPEVVLLDIGMPRLDGYATARQLRRRCWAHRLLIVALTGWGQDEDRRRSNDAGFDRHLVKPVDPAVLQRILEECMQNQSSA